MKLKEPLEVRINELRIECEKFVQARAEELSKGTGVPVVVNLRMLQTTAEGNPFRAALNVIETRKRDKEIAEKEWLKEHHESKQPKPAA